jgi:hypothetical protein
MKPPKTSRRRIALPDFWDNVAINENDCWLWRAANDRDGYGRWKHRLAHRVAYEMQFGKIPAGLEIDHLCRARACVNPAHLEAVLHRTNVLRGEGWAARNGRKEFCIHGHRLSAENMYVHRNGSRHCRLCNLEAVRRHRKKQRSTGLSAPSSAHREVLDDHADG